MFLKPYTQEVEQEFANGLVKTTVTTMKTKIKVTIEKTHILALREDHEKVEFNFSLRQLNEEKEMSLFAMINFLISMEEFSTYNSVVTGRSMAHYLEVFNTIVGKLSNLNTLMGR